jgi:hypothetical protein
VLSKEKMRTVVPKPNIDTLKFGKMCFPLHEIECWSSVDGFLIGLVMKKYGFFLLKISGERRNLKM